MGIWTELRALMACCFSPMPHRQVRAHAFPAVYELIYTGFLFASMSLISEYREDENLFKQAG